MTTPTAEGGGWEAELTGIVERHLDALWAGVAPSVDASSLRATLRDAVNGGKRMRPRLVAGVHDALGGRRPGAVLEAAAAVELLHTAFVIHDDLIDDDDLRRGHHSALGWFRGRAPDTPTIRDTYASAGAVLTGDLALAAAVLAFAALPVPDADRSRVMSLVRPALVTSASGELADVRLAFEVGHHPAEDEVLDLAARKTAAYSFELPMQIGALLAGADDTIVTTAGDSAHALGIAFQLYDDLAGVFENETATGKDPLSDLREGKATLLIAHACTTAAWPAVAPHWGDPGVSTQDLHAVRQALDESGSRAHVESVAAAHLRTGVAVAARAGIDLRAMTCLASLLARGAKEAA